MPDPAKDIKDALAGMWASSHAGGTVTLEVDDDFTPTASSPALLVADDGGPAWLGGAWLVGNDARRVTIRLTAFATGRSQARQLVNEAAVWLLDHRPASVARIEDISAPLITRDRETGAMLGSITMPVITR